MIRTLMIEGFPVCFGEGDAPDWYDGEKLSYLGSLRNRPTISRTIDPLGGVEKYDDVNFDLMDTTGKLSDIFRFIRSDGVDVSADTLLYSDSDITVTDTDHPTNKALYNNGTSATKVDTDWDFAGDHTLEFWWKCGNNTTSQYFFRKTNQSGIVYWGAQHSFYTIAYNNGTSSYSLTKLNISATLNEWYHIIFRYTSGVEYSGFINGVKVSTPTTYISGYSSNPFGLFGIGGATGYYPRGSIAKVTAWKRAITDQEGIDLFEGRSVDETNLFFKSQENLNSKTILDISGNNRHISNNFTNSVTRQFLPSDLLYLPVDTATVKSVNTTTKVITLNRSIFGALEDGYKPYYTKLPNNDYIFTAYAGNPAQYVGRLCVYYEGGHDVSNIKFIGFLKSPVQTGKKWTLTASHILNPLFDGFNVIQSDIALHTEGEDGYYYIGNPTFHAEDDSGNVSNSTPMSGGYSRADMVAKLNLLGGSDWDFWDTGFRYIGNHNKPTAIIDQDSKGLWDVFLNPEGFVTYAGFGQSGWSSLSAPYKKYGLIFGDTSTYSEGKMNVTVDYDNVNNLDGAWIQIGDYYFKITAVTSGGTITIQGAYDKDLNYLPAQTVGISSDDKIKLATAPIAEAPNIPWLFYAVLTSTGDGTNGAYDTLTGALGLGLPAELINSNVTNFGNDWHVRADLSDVKLSDQLKLSGQLLRWDESAGQFGFVKAEVPAITTVKDNLTFSDAGVNQRIQSKWGFIAPVSNFKFETAKGEYLNITAQVANYWIGSQLHQVEITDKTGARFSNILDFREQIFKKLQWLSNYAPTIQLELPGNTYNLGDIIGLTLNNIAGQGNYSIENVPGIVIGKGKGSFIDYVSIMINTANTSLNAAWVPSWEISSYTGTTITLKKGGANWISDRYTLPLTVQIIDSQGGVLSASVNITSITDDDTLILSSAPTYAIDRYIGIITLPDYTSALSDDQPTFVWSADSSGVMSNSDDGKILS